MNKHKEQEYIALNSNNGHEVGFTIKDDVVYHKGKALDFKLEEAGDGFTFLTIDGISYPIEVVTRRQNEYELLINGVSYSFTIETPFSLERRKILAAQTPETSVILLKAPMPGKILDVLVKTGDVVNVGDTLLILEAMKMQNAILASNRATIKKVHVKEGDNTSKSDLLIELERE